MKILDSLIVRYGWVNGKPLRPGPLADRPFAHMLRMHIKEATVRPTSTHEDLTPNALVEWEGEQP